MLTNNMLYYIILGNKKEHHPGWGSIPVVSKPLLVDDLIDDILQIRCALFEIVHRAFLGLL